MINRFAVAKEKLEEAVRLMSVHKVDIWVVYSRINQDPALELLFNYNTTNEVLFVINKDGKHIAYSVKEDLESLKASLLFDQVIEVKENEFMVDFKEKFNHREYKIAVNIAEGDARCDGLTKGLYDNLQKSLSEIDFNKNVVSSYDMLEYLRAVKTPLEIEIMTECSKITTDIYDVVFSQIHVGMSEVDVAKLMMSELDKRNCGTGIGDPSEYPLVLLVRCGMSHRKPSPKNMIKPGDMLVIDFSARYNGYTSDIARTMYFLKEDESQAPEEIKNCIDAAVRAVGATMDVLKPGAIGYDVDAVGRKSIVDSGYPDIRHSVGHQVGLECHDGGTVLGPRRSNPSMCKAVRMNEVYAIEPTVLQDHGLPCCIVEDNVLVTADGCQLISKRQTALIEIPYREA